MSDYQRSHYSVLGVKADATRDEIRRAYRRLAKAHHPDVSGDPDSAARFREVNEAYRVLTDPERPFGVRWRITREGRVHLT